MSLKLKSRRVSIWQLTAYTLGQSKSLTGSGRQQHSEGKVHNNGLKPEGERGKGGVKSPTHKNKSPEAALSNIDYLLDR